MAAMIVSRIVLKNWRNFRGIDVALRDRVFLAGANASGKSNLLDVLRFLRDTAKAGGGLQSAIAKRGGLSKIRCLSARREPDVEIAVELSGEDMQFRYAIGIAQEVRGYRQPYLKYERVWIDGRAALERPDAADRADSLRLTQTHLEQINANVKFREVTRFFESIRYLHLVPQLLRQPDPHPGSATDDPFGRNFLETIAKTPDRTRKARLRKIETALRAAVPQLKDLTDIKDESGVPHLEAIYSHWRPNAGRQREDQFSDGTIRLIGLFWALLDGDAPLLLEEPELSLNPAIVRKLPDLFARLQRTRNRQIFVSTHSADLLSDRGIGGEEVLLLQPGEDGTEVRVSSGIVEIRRLLDAGLSVADAALPTTAPAALEQLSLFP